MNVRLLSMTLCILHYIYHLRKETGQNLKVFSKLYFLVTGFCNTTVGHGARLVEIFQQTDSKGV